MKQFAQVNIRHVSVDIERLRRDHINDYCRGIPGDVDPDEDTSRIELAEHELPDVVVIDIEDIRCS